MEVRHAVAAGLDVHKMQITATVRAGSQAGAAHVETREFSALASGLALLVQWLLSLRVTGAVMEATGIYWEKVYDVLSDAGLDVMVVHAQHVKQIKGSKTDIADSIWLSRSCQFGLASPSLVLPKTFRDLRGLSRYRRKLIEQRAQKQVRMQKVLDRNGIRIGGILSRVTHGVNGRHLIEGLVAGASRETILSGAELACPQEAPRSRRCAELRTRHAQPMDPEASSCSSSTTTPTRSRPPSSASKRPWPRSRTLIRLLETIPGVSRESAMAILIELGPDMSAFPSARHCAAWAGICPGNNESAGKRRSGTTRRGNPTLRAILIECAHAAVRTRHSSVPELP